MKFPESRGIKTAQWLANEILRADDLNYLSEATYESYTELLGLVASSVRDPSSLTDTVISGLQLLWSTGLTSTLKAGAAVSFTGRYFTSDTWGFTASAGEMFAVVVPLDTSIAVDSGGASDRYDTIEIRPVQSSFNSVSRQFKDPVTGLITSALTSTRREYTFEFQIKKGTGGAGYAPTHTAGWIKVAEVFVPASASSISQSNIKYANESASWTTEAGTVQSPWLMAEYVSVRDTAGRITPTNVEDTLQKVYRTLKPETVFLDEDTNIDPLVNGEVFSLEDGLIVSTSGRKPLQQNVLINSTHARPYVEEAYIGQVANPRAKWAGRKIFGLVRGGQNILVRPDFWADATTGGTAPSLVYENKEEVGCYATKWSQAGAADGYGYKSTILVSGITSIANQWYSMTFDVYMSAAGSFYVAFVDNAGSWVNSGAVRLFTVGAAGYYRFRLFHSFGASASGSTFRIYFGNYDFSANTAGDTFQLYSDGVEGKGGSRVDPPDFWIMNTTVLYSSNPAQPCMPSVLYPSRFTIPYVWSSVGALELWVKPDCFYNSDYDFICNTGGATWKLSRVSSKWQATITDVSYNWIRSEQTTADTSDAAFQVWTHLKVAWDTPNKIVKLYINGVEQTASSSGTLGTVNLYNTLQIGHESGTWSSLFNGYITDLHIWSTYDISTAHYAANKPWDIPKKVRGADGSLFNLDFLGNLSFRKSLGPFGISRDLILEEGGTWQGSWIKLSNGVMICWGNIDRASTNITTATGSLYMNDMALIHSFPQQFNAIPTLLFGAVKNSVGNPTWVAHQGTTPVSSTGFYYRYLSTVSHTADVTLSYIAIGQWAY